VTLRWLPMPWLKAALPFGLVAVGLGFALAELALAGNLSAGRIPEYSLFGLRALSALLPVHLALFLLPWLAGVLRLQRDADRDRWRVPVTALAAGVLALALLPLLNPNGPLWPGVAQVMAFPLRAGFGAGSLGLGVLAGGIAAALLLAALAAVSGGFSLTRAAQETQDLENLQAAQRYGFSSLAEDLQTRRRLGVRRAASRLPARAGAGALVWKDLLQAGRAFRLTDLIGWVSLFGAMLTLPLLPDLGSRALVIAVWAQQVGKLVTRRLRSDLSRWVLFRQLPFSGQTVLRYDLLPALAAAGVLSLLGLGLGLALTGSPPEPLLALLPGTVTAAGYAAAYDVLRRSRSSLLLNGSAPEVSALGVIGGVLAVAVPVGISALLQPPALGLFWAVPVSLLLAWLTYRLAARSYTKIDAG
jgi:hypothetical protein